MSRSKSLAKRTVTPDPKFNSVLIARIINRAMRNGKKVAAQAQIYQALELIKTKTNKEPLEVIEQALKNITPIMEVRSRRVGGAAYQVPMQVKPFRASSLAIRWLLNEANKRPNSEYHTFADKFTAEILDALQETGGAHQKKLTSHKMAEANKAFAHFRW